MKRRCWTFANSFSTSWSLLEPTTSITATKNSEWHKGIGVPSSKAGKTRSSEISSLRRRKFRRNCPIRFVVVARLSMKEFRVLIP